MVEQFSQVSDLLTQGDVLKNAGSVQEAVAVFKQAVDMAPELAEAHYKLGTAYGLLSDFRNAEECYREVLAINADHSAAANNLGIIVAKAGGVEEAERLYRQALARQVDYFEAHVNLGKLLAESNRRAEACYYLRRAIILKPDSPVAAEQLGLALRSGGDRQEGIKYIQRAVELDPASPSAWTSLGTCSLHHADYGAAEECYRKALECRSDYPSAWGNLLLVSNYVRRDRGEVFRLHKEFGLALRKSLPQLGDIREGRDFAPNRRLRIGWVSGDLRRHSVSYFVQGVLEHLARRDFELWAYYNHGTEDSRTVELKPLFYRWRPIHGLNDEDLARQIREDRIDILIDLSGHTNHSRMKAFAYRPAPLQISWIGYPNTTGLDCMDYRFTDAIADPEGDADEFHTERLWRLPNCFLAYSPPKSAPAVGELPFHQRGCITFGSFNTRTKLGSETIALWAKVLRAVPGSRLLLKSALGLEEESARVSIREQFAAQGVAAERITVQPGANTLESHLATYGEVDIGLDTFPYHGTTTTCEALWMGVPVITLAGDRHVSRVGVSLLSNAGLSDLIAEDDEQFVDIARQLAENSELLTITRRHLRDVLRGSHLLNVKSMAAHVGEAFRSMWRAVCEDASRDGAQKPGAEIEAEQIAARLIIGGNHGVEGWKIFSAEPGEGVDFDGDLSNLNRFGDESYNEVYCAHILQRLPQAAIVDYVRELHRILRPGGRLYLSVPDMDALAWLFCSPLNSKADKFHVMRSLFGHQADEHDFHQIGLNMDFLQDYLGEAGFSSMERVASFGLFDDGSESRIGESRVSLNLVAFK